MPWRTQTGHPLTTASLLAHAPVKQGGYAIKSGSAWLYFGYSDDLRRRLLDHLQDRAHPIHKYPNLEFLCEVTPTAPDRLRQLLIEFHPACNSPFD
jgi:hypothetical protein